MTSGSAQRSAEALLRRRREVGPAEVASELQGADVSELRRWILVKLRADDLEADEVPVLVRIAAHAGLGRARRDVAEVAEDPRAHGPAREAARLMLG
jgi:hypothetical protein